MKKLIDLLQLFIIFILTVFFSIGIMRQNMVGLEIEENLRYQKCIPSDTISEMKGLAGIYSHKQEVFHNIFFPLCY